MINISMRQRLVLAAISGILGGLSFPSAFYSPELPNLGIFAWFFLVPLLIAIESQSVRNTFILTFVTGFFYHSVSLFWLYNTMTLYGHIGSVVSVGLIILLTSFLSLYCAFALAWVRWAANRCNVPALFLIPVAWVLAEYTRNYIPAGGFPWNNIGYSQSGYPLLIQIADIFGVYGVTFLIIAVNAALTQLVLLTAVFPPFVREGREGRESIPQRRVTYTGILVIAALFALSVGYGWYRLETIDVRPVNAGQVKIALVQGNIPQEEKWNPELLDRNVEIYKKNTELLSDSGVSLVIWPEAAFPYLVPQDTVGFDPKEMGLTPGSTAPWLMFGAISVSGEKTKATDYYNSTILLDSYGKIADRYYKVHLVPFGEYVPWKKFLFFAGKMVNSLADFSSGSSYKPLKIRDSYNVAPLICYEDVFPEISRKFVLAGANVLINMTNDAWHGRTSAPYQHLAESIMRAVENRRYVLRAANTGISAVINSKGNVELRTNIFEPGLLVANVPILRSFTIYHEIGDLLPNLCIIIFLLVMIMIVVSIFPPLRIRGGRRGYDT